MKSMKVSLALGTALTLVCAANAQPIMQDTFSYADGALTNVAAGTWLYHSGSGGALTLNVVNGRAFIHQNDGEGGHDDYNRSINGSFDPLTDNTSALFASFVVNFSALPFSSGTALSGSYFAHFKSSSANEFYTRIGANQESSTGSTFRLAIANEAWDAAKSIEFPQDLTLDTDYLVVVKLDLATDQSTLWVNPTSESSASVTATDTFTYAGVINGFALRQGTTGSSGNVGAPGDLYLDNLMVGTSFESVTAVPEPSTAALMGIGALALLRHRRKN